MFMQNVPVRYAMLEVDLRLWIRSGIYGRCSSTRRITVLSIHSNMFL
jgi:hypothetical protein